MLGRKEGARKEGRKANLLNLDLEKGIVLKHLQKQPTGCPMGQFQEQNKPLLFNATCGALLFEPKDMFVAHEPVFNRPMSFLFELTNTPC